MLNRNITFMAKCKWYFRQSQYDDKITGSNGEEVKSTKEFIRTNNKLGKTSFQKLLWGQDADKFNPDREFKDNELRNNEHFAAYNQYEDRFRHYTYPPECIGKNFTQMEATVVLIYSFSKFSFKLDNCFQHFDLSTYYGINRGTLSPIDHSKNIVKNGKNVHESGMPLNPIYRI